MDDNTVIDAISAQLPHVETAVVEQVMAAYRAVTSGAPLGTVVIDPNTGAVAHRISEGGVHVWAVSAPSGNRWTDMQANLSGWRTVRTGTGTGEGESE